MILIRWRPSGGRGEYEYIAGPHQDLLGKSIVVQVPRIGSQIKTDVSFEHVDGKPRLRRAAPNDRSHLNLPPLVSAIAALPNPRRADLGPISFPLADKGYVVSEIGCEVITASTSKIVVEPVYLRPLHGSAIDIEPRLDALQAVQATNMVLSNFLQRLGTGVNDAQLATAAENVHQLFPYAPEEEASLVSGEVATLEDEDISTYSGTEGRERIRIHRFKERDRGLARIAKRLFRKRHGALFCECCRFDFERTYGKLGSDFIEAHHRVPLSHLTEIVETTPDDLAMLCSNCHRMVHRAPDCSVDFVVSALKVQATVT